MRFIILVAVTMASGTTQEIKLGETYPTMDACEAAKADATARYGRAHPDAKIQKAECIAA